MRLKILSPAAKATAAAPEPRSAARTSAAAKAAARTAATKATAPYPAARAAVAERPLRPGWLAQTAPAAAPRRHVRRGSWPERSISTRTGIIMRIVSVMVHRHIISMRAHKIA